MRKRYRSDFAPSAKRCGDFERMENRALARGRSHHRKRHDRNATKRHAVHSFSRPERTFWRGGNAAPRPARDCSRMVGSVPRGEDVDRTLWRAGYDRYTALQNPPALRLLDLRLPTIERSDHLRQATPDRRHSDNRRCPPTRSDPTISLPREQAITLAMADFRQLAPSQRSGVI